MLIHLEVYFDWQRRSYFMHYFEIIGFLEQRVLSRDLLGIDILLSFDSLWLSLCLWLRSGSWYYALWLLESVMEYSTIVWDKPGYSKTDVFHNIRKCSTTIQNILEYCALHCSGEYKFHLWHLQKKRLAAFIGKLLHKIKGPWNSVDCFELLSEFLWWAMYCSLFGTNIFLTYVNNTICTIACTDTRHPFVQEI